MPISMEDLLKLALPLLAGGASAYSRPAARAIEGSTGVLMAQDEAKRREAMQAQEMALRQQEADQRAKVLGLQGQRTQQEIDQANREYAGQQAAAGAIGQVLGTASGADTYQPIPAAPPSEDQFALAQAARTAQASLSDPRLSGPMLGHFLGLLQAQGGERSRSEDTKTRLSAEAAEKAKDRAISKPEAEARAAYWKTEGEAAKERSAAAKQNAETGAKKAESGKPIDPAKLAKDIAEAQTNFNEAVAAKDAMQQDLWGRKLQELQAEYARLSGGNTGAGYLRKLGIVLPAGNIPDITVNPQ